MSNKPRKHHFVPQFWIRKFKSSDQKIWSYDKETDCIGSRSSKQIMQIFNLYTVQPSGVDDTTLETVDLGKVDTDGSRVFDSVLNGDRSEEARSKLADFLAVQILRDPEVVTTYNPKAQELALSLLEIFQSQDYETFLTKWQAKYPKTEVTEVEFAHIQSMGLIGLENEIDKIITALDTTEGIPELPFTDVVRSPDSRKSVTDKLLGLEWMIKTTTADKFILGDIGVIYNKGDMINVSVPLSPNAALFLTYSKSPKNTISSSPGANHDVQKLNFETAARSRRWIVGEVVELNKHKSQVGAKPL